MRSSVQLRSSPIEGRKIEYKGTFLVHYSRALYSAYSWQLVEEKLEKVVKSMCALEKRKDLLSRSIEYALEKLQDTPPGCTVNGFPNRLEKIPSGRRTQGAKLLRALGNRRKGIFARSTHSVTIFGKRHRKVGKKNQYRKPSTTMTQGNRMSSTALKKQPFLRTLVQQGRNKKNQATIYIQSTHNNTIYTLTSIKKVLQGVPTPPTTLKSTFALPKAQKIGGQLTSNWVSAGTCGFKNTRKATSYASQAAAEKIALLAKNLKITDVNIKIKGLGPGKLSGVRTLHQSGLRVQRIWECTTLPHNGCRPAKSRRI